MSSYTMCDCLTNPGPVCYISLSYDRCNYTTLLEEIYMDISTRNYLWKYVCEYIYADLMPHISSTSHILRYIPHGKYFFVRKINESCCKLPSARYHMCFYLNRCLLPLQYAIARLRHVFHEVREILQHRSTPQITTNTLDILRSLTTLINLRYETFRFVLCTWSIALYSGHWCLDMFPILRIKRTNLDFVPFVFHFETFIALKGPTVSLDTRTYFIDWIDMFTTSGFFLGENLWVANANIFIFLYTYIVSFFNIFKGGCG